MSLRRSMAASLGGFDADALAFIVATGISNATQKNAINRLTKDLKIYGLWSKFSAIYPVVGGTAATHKYNLKNPLDTDAAFRLVFSGTGLTHSSNGFVGNAAAGFADTKLTPSTTLSLNSTHVSYYSRTSRNDTTAFRDLGAIDGAANNIQMLVRFSNNMRTEVNSNTLSSTVIATGAGLFLATRLSSTNQQAYFNGGLVADYAVTSSGLPAVPIYLSALNNNGSTAFFGNRQCAFATIGSGLDATESLNFYDIVQAFQTKLGRQV